MVLSSAARPFVLLDRSYPPDDPFGNRCLGLSKAHAARHDGNETGDAMTSEIHAGGCQCGAVRYETVGEPARAAVCHCRYCQTRTGSAFGISIYFPSEAVTILSGDLKDYAFTTESGGSFTTQFCTTCGTSVFWTLSEFPGLIGIAGGTFDPPTFWYDMKREVFTRSKAPFLHLDVADSFETSTVHAPVEIEPPHLRGG